MLQIFKKLRAYQFLSIILLIIMVVAAWYFKEYHYGKEINPLHVKAAGATAPELPREYVDTSMPTQTGATIAVNSGGNLQTAFNNAQPGDTIVLEAGASFTGNFTLPNKTNPSNKWIVVKSSQVDYLPEEGNRVSPSDATHMAKIVGANPTYAISADQQANYWRFVGIEVTDNGGSTQYGPALPGGGNGGFSYGLVSLGELGRDTQLSQVPHHIIFDRSYLHGLTTSHNKFGISMNGSYEAVIDSYLSDFHGVGQDTQAVNGYNGPGPFKINNNYLSAAGENVIFGGADPSITNLVPSDVEIRNNYFYKPLTWKVGDPAYGGITWTVKNLFETKNIQRLIFENNILDNTWVAAQEFAIVLKTSNQDGGCSWCVSQDLTMRNNILRNSENGFSISALDEYSGGGGITQRRVLIENNILENAGNKLFQISGGSSQGPQHDIAIKHNTAWDVTVTASYPEAFVFGDSAPIVDTLDVLDNIFIPGPDSGYSVFGSDYGFGVAGLNYYMTNHQMLNNIFILANDDPKNIPNNFYPSRASAGFTNAAGGDYSLTSGSAYHNAATDGTDPGANYSEVLAATENTISGQNAGSSPAPDTTPPVMSSGTPSGAQAAGTTSVNLTLTTNETATCKYGTVASQAYASKPSTFSTTNSTSHSTSVSGLSNGNSYTYYVRCQDSSSNATTIDLTISFSVSAPAGDTTVPTVSFTAPSNGATVSGSSVAVTATASDNVAVVGVQFKLDGTNLGSEDTSSPYSITWDTAVASNSSHTLTAVARDAAGNTVTTTRTVTVNNVVPPTTVATPSISPNGGSFSSAQSVTLSTTTSGASTYYTTDGSTPSSSSTLYTSEFTVSTTTTVKAIAIKAGLTDSSISSTTFTVNIPAPPSGGGGGGGSSGGSSSPSTSSTRLVNSGGTYYFIQAGIRKGITSPGILNSCGFDFSDAVSSSSSDNSLPQGSLLLPCDGALVRSQQDPTVYLISHNTRYAFVSPDVFLSLGFKFASVLFVTNPELQSIPRADNLTNPSQAHLPGTDINVNGTIYWIDETSTKHPYPSLEVYNSWHIDGDFSTVVQSNASDLTLPTGGNVSVRG